MATSHDTLVIEREFRAPLEKVFQAITTLEGRRGWFKGPEGWVESERSVDCRVGGTEVMRGTFKDGTASSYSAYFYVVEANGRLVYSFDVVIGGKVFSASLATMEFSPSEGGTKMRFTEQLAYIDNPDPAKAHENRYVGTNWGFDNLEAFLNPQ